MRLSSGDRRWITFKYERLSNFFYVCGCVTFVEVDCEKLVLKQLQGVYVARRYDAKLRADGFQAITRKFSAYEPKATSSSARKALTCESSDESVSKDSKDTIVKTKPDVEA